MQALTLEEFKALMKSAYSAGESAQKRNNYIDRLLDDGTKQCPARPSFDDWFKENIIGGGSLADTKK